MHTVQIANDVYGALQRLAVPFEDDINDVLRRVLHLRQGRANNNGDGRPAAREAAALSLSEHPADPTHRDANDGATVIVHRRTTNGAALPQSTYRTTVLGTVRSTKSSVSVAKLMRSVEQQLANRMTDTDLEPLPSGLTRWQSQVRNALMQLQHEGAIEQVEDGWYRYLGNGHTTC